MCMHVRMCACVRACACVWWRGCLCRAKQDTANKFWSAVEQYCAPITENDIRIVRQAIAVVSLSVLSKFFAGT